MFIEATEHRYNNKAALFYHDGKRVSRETWDHVIRIAIKFDCFDTKLVDNGTHRINYSYIRVS